MTSNEIPEQDWDKGLEDLVSSVDADSAAEATEETARDTPVDPQAVPPTVDADCAELLAERTLDLQRLQAEYVNYKRRVDRDRDVAHARGVEAVLSDMLPVLDGIDAARAHGELTGGAKMLADELAKVAAKYGLVEFGAEGDPFDPHIHEALMHIDKPGYPVMSVAQVFQKGFMIKDRVIRPARVGVADADESAITAGVDAPQSTPGSSGAAADGANGSDATDQSTTSGAQQADEASGADGR
ncbi:MAG: nucleotide exchange factor GrpE [Propionibacteriaceae bacterium]|jgi:molecular chaperone GrpE|nr:nucleotide exchange factor GrpE [Propionibacteriaceae bacterium]